MAILFKEHVAKFINISPEEFEEVCEYFERVPVPKKENLLTAG